jgi:diadenosine tetraphosphatase ApaH/serine/threonine PP2A family protein phosphatase
LLAQLQQDPRVIAKLGRPVAMTADAIHGHLRIEHGNKPDGDAELSFGLRGPNGSSQVDVTARLHQAHWAVSALELGKLR